MQNEAQYEKLGNYIDGAWLTDTAAGEDVINPATEAVLGRLPHASEKDLDRALAAAERAAEGWRKRAPFERAAIMRVAAGLIRERLESIAVTMTLEQGKPIAEARSEIARAADMIDWCAEEGRRTYGRVIPAREANVRQIVVQEPVGPVAAFTPWNFPTFIPSRKIGGALAAGCTCILKPAEETPGSALALARAFHDAGLPPGVLNIVFGKPADVSRHLIQSPVIRKVTFTGSVPVGKHLAALAGQHMKAATMELGGHAPVIVFGDADPEKVARLSAAAKFRNAGQICTAPTRFFVHADIHARFAEALAEAAQGIKVGDGMDTGVRMGPLANGRRVTAIGDLVADAQKRGGTVLAGGRRLGNSGYFFEPTVLADVPDDAAVMTQEPFGPVAIVTSFRETTDAIARANSLPFGLAGYAFTDSHAAATAVIDGLEVGALSINRFSVSEPEAPFGGVKDSGFGREGGIEAVATYQIQKFVSHGSI
jgi:succinate-semialdehyde dehydrogenase/glutarate-semialdehyde dehydrogenase